MSPRVPPAAALRRRLYAPAARLRRRLYERLGPRAAALRGLAREARELGVGIWLVGGPVRDLLLGASVRDVDLLLSDRVPEVAARAASALGGRVTRHDRFLTARVDAPTGCVDLARARRETYPRPGALPEVRPATPDADLARRDFSVNAIALPLGPERELLDPCGGRRDLEAGVLRVLHARSFVDDPTRLFRAARYAARLGFRLERRTAALAARARDGGALDTLSGARMRREVERLLEEPAPAEAVARSAKLGLFGACVPGWRPGARTLRSLRRACARGSLPDVRLRLLLLEASPRTRQRVLERLGIRGRPARDLIADLGVLPALGRSLTADLTPGRLDARLGGLSERALETARSALPDAAARKIDRYWSELRTRPSPLDGHAARALGAHGDEVGALLRAARRRALDGAPVDAAWSRRWLARRRAMG